MVQRLARGPFKAEIRVRFPLALPILRANAESFGSGQYAALRIWANDSPLPFLLASAPLSDPCAGVHANRRVIALHRVLQRIARLDSQRLANFAGNRRLPLARHRGMRHAEFLTWQDFLTSTIFLTFRLRASPLWMTRSKTYRRRATPRLKPCFRWPDFFVGLPFVRRGGLRIKKAHAFTTATSSAQLETAPSRSSCARKLPRPSPEETSRSSAARASAPHGA